MSASVVEPRKCEAGLLVFANFMAAIKVLRAATLLPKEIIKQRNKLSQVDLSFNDSKIAK